MCCCTQWGLFESNHFDLNSVSSISSVVQVLPLDAYLHLGKRLEPVASESGASGGEGDSANDVEESSAACATTGSVSAPASVDSDSAAADANEDTYFLAGSFEIRKAKLTHSQAVVEWLARQKRLQNQATAAGAVRAAQHARNRKRIRKRPAQSNGVKNSASKTNHH